jgi:hypothetical protein
MKTYDGYYLPLTGIKPLRNPPSSNEPPAPQKIKYSLFSCINRSYEWINDTFEKIIEKIRNR